MLFREIAAFDVVHAELDWPWIAFAASGDHVAFASSRSEIATRRLDGDRLTPGPSFALPADLTLRPGSEGRAGLTAFAISVRPGDGGAHLAVTGVAGDAPVVAIVDPNGDQRRADIADVLGPEHDVQALAFDRTGHRLWISAENPTETVVLLLDVATLARLGEIRSSAFPRPALHELHRHSVDDAILLLAACGEEGSFARVVGFAGDVVSAVPTELDGGAIAAGFVGFSADGARVHLVEADELRTHAWPTLHELSSVPLADDFVSSFSGAVLGDEIFVDGEVAETHGDAVMLFDRAAIHGAILPFPAPAGMWAGRLGRNAIVTVQAKGDPVRARVLVRTESATKAFGAKHLLS